MPKSPDLLKTQLDPVVDVLWGDIRAFQEDYLAGGKGRYFQGLPTHTAPPKSDGAAVPCDKLASKPHYQNETWPDVYPSMPADLPVSIEQHQYVQHDGTCGYVAFFTFRDDTSNAWITARQSGPETWRAHGWQQQVTP